MVLLSSQELTDYEKERAEKIRTNMEKLAALGIQSAASKLVAKPPAPLTAARRKAPEAAPAPKPFRLVLRQRTTRPDYRDMDREEKEARARQVNQFLSCDRANGPFIWGYHNIEHVASMFASARALPDTPGVTRPFLVRFI